MKNYLANKDLKIDYDVADHVPPVLGRNHKGYISPDKDILFA